MSANTIPFAPSPPRLPPPAERPACLHCGAPLADARGGPEGFCCAGCAYVFRLVHEHELEGYYRIKDAVTVPADRAVFEPRDYSWLGKLQEETDLGGSLREQREDRVPALPRRATAEGPGKDGRPGAPELTLSIQGVSCAGCVWLIERLFRREPGARDIVVNAQLGTVRLRWVGEEFSAADFARRLQAFGYLLGPPDAPGGSDTESRDLAKRTGLCTAFAMNAMLFSLPVYFGMGHDFAYAGLFGILAMAFGTLSLLAGGGYFLARAWRAARARALHIDLPVALGITGSYAGSMYGWAAGREEFVYFDFVSAFILLMLAGRWAQVAAVERNRRRLLRLQPAAQAVEVGGRGRVAPGSVRRGDLMTVVPGQAVPVAARVGDGGAGTFSLASINGEPEPRVFRAGAAVPAGAVNIGRTPAALHATQDWKDSLLARLLEPGDRGPSQNPLLERIVGGYLIGIIGIAAGSGIFWAMATGDAVRTWSVVVAVLVVSCPCAVGLAFPLADELATVALRQRGVFVRLGDLWSRLGRVRTVVFDKTGTLTLETPVLQNPEALASLDPGARDALLALVRDTPHPVCQALLEALLASGPSATTPGSCHLIRDMPAEPATCPVVPDTRVPGLAGTPVETVGQGVELGPWSLGRPGWRSPRACHAMRDMPQDAEHPRTGLAPDDQQAAESGQADVVLAHNGGVVARFRFADAVRSDAAAEVGALRRLGLGVAILSGDRPAKVARMAGQLGIDPGDAVGGCTPEDKARWLRARPGDDALMLGDGANDSLAFAQALCRGTPVVHRGVLAAKSDFYYLGRGIGGIRFLFEVDRVRRHTQCVILVFSVLYNLLAVGLAVAGRMNPLVAAVLMPVNSLATLAIVTLGMKRASRRRDLGSEI